MAPSDTKASDTVPALLPTDQWSEDLAEVVGTMQGNPLNVHRLMAHHPELLKAWWPLRQHAVSGGSLGNRLGELLILRVAVHRASWYEWASHVDRGLRVGLRTEEINAVLLRDPGTVLADEERLLLRAVDELSQLGHFAAETDAALQSVFSREQVLDVIAIHGMYSILAAMLATWDSPLDEDVQRRIADHTTKTTFLAAAKDFRNFSISKENA